MLEDTIYTPLTSAVLIIAPPEVAAFTDPIREAHLRGNGDVFRVPAHFSVMFPFVSPGTIGDGPDPAILEATIHKLKGVCAEAEPFSVTIDHYGSFPGVLYLAPQDPAPIVALHQRILAAFPDYLPYGGAFGDFTPHMTLARFEDEAAMDAFERPDFAPMTFQVDAVQWRYGDLLMLESWTVAARIPLGR